jgi:transcriptional regulator with XRE-family HTH domain
MADEHRKAVLRHLLDHVLVGGRAQLMRKSGFKKSYVSQLLDPKRPFGERTARKIALRLKLPADYFEKKIDAITIMSTSGIGGALDEREAKQLLIYWQHFTSSQRTRLMAEMEAKVAENIAIAKHLNENDVVAKRDTKVVPLKKKVTPGGDG